MSTTNRQSLHPEPWRSKRTVAAHYEISVRTVERWIQDGCVSRLIGGMRRLRYPDVEAYLASKEA